ncbi:hypothetical protein CP02DC14_1038A, partial [Chlamydia psittaci 02DC14]
MMCRREVTPPPPP